MFSTIGYWICIPFAALLRLFYNATDSYGVALILFTLVIKLILLPFQMKSKRSMVRMNRMQGRVQEIQKKYANNQAKMQEELNKFYMEEGFNPMSGCLWSFLPLPIMIALYSIIRRPIVYFMDLGAKAERIAALDAARKLITDAGIDLGKNAAYEEIAIAQTINSQFPEFASQTEGWININYNFLGVDLTTIPTNVIEMVKNGGLTMSAIVLVLIPILCGALGFLQSKVSTMGQENNVANASTKTMLMFMPLMSIYIGFIMPAALGVYWVAQSVFSIIQEWILGKFYNQKIEEEETAREEARQADRKRRMEEAKENDKLRQHQESKKQTLREKQQAAQEAKAEKAKKAANATTEAGRVDDRPYARGRAYKADRYDEQ